MLSYVVKRYAMYSLLASFHMYSNAYNYFHKP